MFAGRWRSAPSQRETRVRSSPRRPVQPSQQARRHHRAARLPAPTQTDSRPPAWRPRARAAHPGAERLPAPSSVATSVPGLTPVLVKCVVTSLKLRERPGEAGSVRAGHAAPSTVARLQVRGGEAACLVFGEIVLCTLLCSGPLPSAAHHCRLMSLARPLQRPDRFPCIRLIVYLIRPPLTHAWVLPSFHQDADCRDDFLAPVLGGSPEADPLGQKSFPLFLNCYGPAKSPCLPFWKRFSEDKTCLKKKSPERFCCRDFLLEIQCRQLLTAGLSASELIPNQTPNSKLRVHVSQGDAIHVVPTWRVHVCACVCSSGSQEDPGAAPHPCLHLQLPPPGLSKPWRGVEFNLRGCRKNFTLTLERSSHM